MNSLSNVRVISVDLFRTLVDVDQSLEAVWRIFLKDHYSSELAEKYWARGTEIVLEKYQSAAADFENFINCRKIYEDTYSQLFREIKVNFDPKAAAGVLVEAHKVQNFFPDVAAFLGAVKGKHALCLSTDCDSEMIAGMSHRQSFDRMFISEELQAYKMNPKFFRSVIEHYCLPPEVILHIGDSEHDILTPKNLGITTCWLNRTGKEWKHDVKPDFEVGSLLEVLSILNQ